VTIETTTLCSISTIWICGGFLVQLVVELVVAAGLL